MMTMNMDITKMKFTRNMTQGYFQEWAAAFHSQEAVQEAAFQEAAQAEAQEAAFRVEVQEAGSQAEAQVAGSQEAQAEDSKAEELQHHRRHLLHHKNPRHQHLLLIQEALEGACTDIRMFG